MQNSKHYGMYGDALFDSDEPRENTPAEELLLDSPKQSEASESSAIELILAEEDNPLSDMLTVLGMPIKEGYTLDRWIPYGNHQILLLQKNQKTAYLGLYDWDARTGQEVELPDLQAYSVLLELEQVEGAQIGLQHSPEWMSSGVQYDMYDEDLQLVRSINITYPPERYDSGAWVIFQDGSGTAYIQNDTAKHEGNKGELWRADADGSNPRLVLNCMEEFDGGGIWSMGTKGAYLYFDLTSNPNPGPWGQGIMHIPSETYYFREGVDSPSLLMDGKMLLAGNMYMGTFGKAMHIYEFKTDTLTRCPYFEDVLLFSASDNARYLGGVWGDYDAQTITLNASAAQSS